jgi:hypothetical protein
VSADVERIRVILQRARALSADGVPTVGRIRWSWLTTAVCCGVVALMMGLLGGARPLDADTVGGLVAVGETVFLTVYAVRRGHVVQEAIRAGREVPSARRAIGATAALAAVFAVCALIGMP